MKQFHDAKVFNTRLPSFVIPKNTVNMEDLICLLATVRTLHTDLTVSSVMDDELLQSDPFSSSDFRFDGCPVTSEEGHKRDHVTRKCENEFQKTRWRHQQKLNRLIGKSQAVSSGLSPKRNTAENPELGGEQLKEWVVNLSQYKLTNPQTTVLGEGLNYTPSPTAIPYEDYIIGLFQIIMNLPLWRTSEFHTFFSPFCIGIHTSFGNFALESILFSAMFLEFLTFVCHRFGEFRHFSDMNFGISYAKPPKSNITKEEREAISELKKVASIIILPADKGKTTVVMQSEEYEQNLMDMLNDGKDL